MKRAFFLALALLIGLTPGVQAQFATGNVYGVVTDESGQGVPDVKVSVSTPSWGWPRRSRTAPPAGASRLSKAPADKPRV